VSAPEQAATPTPPAAPGTAKPRRRRLASWWEHHRWSAFTSLARLASRPLGSLLTIAVMGLALALPLTFFLLLGNVQRLGATLGQTQAVNVFLASGQSAVQAQALAGQIGTMAGVATVRVKTPQQGLQELGAMQGFSTSLDLLDDNPLPYVLQVLPGPQQDAPAVASLVGELRGLAGVAMVQDAGAWRQRLDALLAIGNRAVLVLASLLALAALLVVGNTVRVDIASRSQEIAVLVLLGAGPRFVRRPYVYAGVWYGLLGGALAALLAAAVEWSLLAPARQLNHAYAGKLTLAGLPLWLLLGMPLATAVLGWLAARLVSGWQLRRMP